MGDKTGIEWCDATWNPVVGCSVYSPGCKHCYAMRQAARLERMGQARYAGLTRMSKARDQRLNGTPYNASKGIPVWNGTVRLVEHALDQPLRWKSPRRIFVNSMSDLFHENLPDAAIDKVFAIMALGLRHTFIVLTKRAGRMKEYLISRSKSIEHWEKAACDEGFTIKFDGLGLVPFPLPNVWLGVSAEDQERADERVPLLLDTPAAIRFVSAEPLLGPIDLARICLLPQKPGSIRAGVHLNALAGRYCESGMFYKGEWDIAKPPPDIPAQHLDWVIVGGESGPKARPMHPDWARSIRDQCQSAGVPFFFKQWGEWLWLDHGETPATARWPTDGDSRAVVGDFNPAFFRVGKKAAGAMLDGHIHRAFP